MVRGFFRPRLLERRPFLVGRLLFAGDDVCEVLRGTGVLLEVGHMVLEGICQVVGAGLAWVEGVFEEGVVRVPVVFGVGGISAQDS